MPDAHLDEASRAIAILYDIAAAANVAETVEEAFDFALQRLCRQQEWQYGHVFEIAEDDEPKLRAMGIWCDIEWFAGEELRGEHDETTFHAGSGLPGEVLATGEPAWTENATEALAARGIENPERFGLRSGAAFPVLSGDRVVSVLEFFSTREIPRTEELRNLLQGVGLQLARPIERRQAHAALEESRRFTQRIADSVPSIVCLYDLEEQRHVYVNQRVRPILGYAIEDLERLRWEIVHPGDRARLEDARRRLTTASDDDVIEAEFRLQSTPNGWIWCHLRSVVFGRDHEGRAKLVLCTLRDISRRKDLEIRIANLVDQERLRLGQTLHESLGQSLTGIGLLAERLRQQLARDGSGEADHAASLVDHLRDAQKQVRALARGLLPVEVDGAGLMSALEKMVDDARHLFDTEVEFRCTQPVEIENNTAATHLFHIAQEAFHNALMHSRARGVIVELRRDLDRIHLSIIDDGRGMRTVDAERSGFGQRIMRYRAELIDATLTVQSEEGVGTTIVCSWNCNGGQASA